MAAPEEILQTGLFDFVMRGEAKDALLEFVDTLAAGEDVRTIRKLGFMENGAVRLNPVRPLPDLKKLPLKDYGIFDDDLFTFYSDYVRISSTKSLRTGPCRRPMRPGRRAGSGP
jgi:radical SAM superfamily enzyme YgiQ (UPF0313 family)